MKGFGRILMLAFLMVATLGHAKQSLAQPGSADAFNSRMPISGASGYDSGSNLGASKEIGEPNHAGNSGGASVWWTWTTPKGDEVTFNTQGSDFDTLLAVYTGESLNRLKAVGSNDDTGGTLQSEVRFVAQQGQTYHVAVDGYGGATGAIVLNWQTSGAQPLNVGNGVSTTVDNQILVELFPEDTTEPNPFDLDGLTLLFTPDGEGGYAREVRSLAWEADIGSAVTDGAVITLDNFGFDFAGQRWDAFHVSQHGLVTFGGPFTYSYLETGRFKIMHDVAAEFVDGPTISPLYKPMSRAWWGDDGHDVAQYVARWPDRVVVTWHTKEMASYVHGVPPENPIRFQMVLYADGGIAFNYADVALRDGIVGLFPDAEVTRGHLIARIADPTDAELPGHLDLLDVAIYESNTDALIVEWTMRDGIPPPPSGTHYSYRLYFDTDEPYFGGDEDFEFMWSVDVATDDSWTRGGRRLPTSAANRVALLVEDAAARGITASIKPDAAQFDDGRFVQGNWKSRAEQITLPSAPPRVDLSRSDGRFSSRQSEVFHYRSLRDLDSIVCRVIGTLGDEFDLFVFHSEFRTDSQESATAWRSYQGNTSITGTGGGLRPEAPCGEGRLKGRWESVIWMESDTVWAADHTRIHGVHRVRTGWDRGLTLFAHEFTHVGAAFASFVNRDGEREPLYGNFCRCHWRWDLHQPAAFPWYTEEDGIGSIMGDGVYWQDNGNGTFTLSGSFWGTGLSWLDLYMMGLADAHEVPDTFILRNLREVGGNRWRGDPEMISINQIIAAEGPREPRAARSQKVFNAAFVYLLEPGQRPSGDLLDLHGRYRDKVQEHWWHITGGRSQITTNVPDTPGR